MDVGQVPLEPQGLGLGVEPWALYGISDSELEAVATKGLGTEA